MLSGLNASWSFCEPFLSHVQLISIYSVLDHQLVVRFWHGASVSNLFFAVFHNLNSSIFSVSPALVKNGLAFGKHASEEYPLMTYFSMTLSDPQLYAVHPSPRFWLLWPGVLIMLMYSFADVILTIVPLVRGP